MIEFTCQACGKKIAVQNKFAGKAGKCPKCKELLRVPAADPVGDELEDDELGEKPDVSALQVLKDALDDEDQRLRKYRDMIVTTGDLKEPYDVVGLVFFQVSNKGLFSSQLDKLVKQYATEITQMREQGQIGEQQIDWGVLYGQFSVGQTEFEKAFYVAVQELKKRALLLDADAIVSVRQDIDLDTNNFQFFYLQMYGTAVRFK